MGTLRELDAVCEDRAGTNRDHEDDRAHHRQLAATDDQANLT